MTERRGQTRSNLRVPVLLLPSARAVPIRTLTDNVSMDGFFCHAKEAFAPGEQLKFLLLLPRASKDFEPTKATCLQGVAEVVRVIANASREDFGIGCRLTGYHVLTNLNLSSDELSAFLSEEGRFETWLVTAS